MIEKFRESRGWQFLLIVTLILIVPLIVDINGRMSVLRRMHQEKARLTSELAEVQAEHQTLQAELEFVASDAYLERWARVEARMTRPGEIVIVPLIAELSEQPTSILENDPFHASVSPSIPEQWHRLFFGDAVTP